MTRRQTKLPFTRRVIAAWCVVLWLAGISACNLKALIGCASHGDAAPAQHHGEHFHDTHAHHSEGSASRTLHGQLHKEFALRRDLRLESAYF